MNSTRSSKYIWIIGSILIASLSGVSCIFAQTEIFTPLLTDSKIDSSASYIPGEIIVKLKPSSKRLRSTSSFSTLQTFATAQGLTDVEPLGNSNIAVMTIDDESSVAQKIADLQSLENVEYAEPNYLYHTQAFNDTSTGNLWGLSRISGYQAFDIFSGDTNPAITGTIVAIIDAGVAYDHPDLINQMRDGSSCKDENGNSLNNCLHGYDMFDNDSNPYPVRSTHGTHVAGTIAAEANNAQGILGVNFHAKIMALRAGDDSLSLASIMRSIYFAQHNGAKIINASFGGSSYSTGLYDAIRDFGSAGGLFIAAAGNGGDDGIGDDNDIHHNYPSDYNLTNIISVAATTQSDGLASFSNYGRNSVDIGAPGISIYSSIVSLPQSNISTNTFDTSLGNFSTGGTQSSRGVFSGMAMGGFNGFTTTYTSNISDSYIYKTINLAGYSGYDLAVQTYCDTPSGSTGDFVEVRLVSNSDESILLQTNKYYGPYINEDDGAHLIDYVGTSEGNFYKETFVFDLNTFRDTSLTIKAYRYADASLDQTTQAGCMINYLLLSGDMVGSPSYGYLHGTSMATPHVAGLASLARSYRPELSYLDIKNAILSGGNFLLVLSGKTVSSNIINAYTTLYSLTSAPVGSLTFLSGNFSSTSGIVVRLTTNKTGTYLITGSGVASGMSGTITLTGKDIPLTLTPGDGNKTIGVTFYDMLNKPSSLYTASIFLDTTPPTLPFIISPLSGTTLSGTISLLRNAAVDTGGISGYLYQISTASDMSGIIMSGIVATTGVNITLITGDTTYYRSVQALDNVGLSSSWAAIENFLLLRDNIPDAFSFASVTDATLTTAYTRSLVVQGITTGSVLTIINGTYQINNTGDFLTTTGRVYSGDIVTIKVTSSSFYSTPISATLTIGGSSSPFTVTTKASSGGGGGGGGSSSSSTPIASCTLSQMVCSGGVYVRKSGITSKDCRGGSYLDKNCSLSISGIITSGTTTSGTQVITATTSTPTLTNSPFTPELNNAYLYAYTIGITSMPSIQRANMTGTLIRAHMAKMMVNYAIKVLKSTPDTSRRCIFSDIDMIQPEIQAYITLSCQLGLMGVNLTRFDPYGEVTRAHFGTTLSRALYGDTYNRTGIEYYLDHLSALQNAGIITNNDPDLQELRGYVMLMLMRSAQ